jgi:hypothetical protein
MDANVSVRPLVGAIAHFRKTEWSQMTTPANINPLAVEHLPSFVTAPGETDVLMIVVGLFLLGIVVGFGVFYFTLHSIPERIAHRTSKMQFEIVAVLCLLALFTHEYIFWVLALLLAMITIPDFISPLNTIARSVEKLAGFPPGGAIESNPVEPTGSHATVVDPPPHATPDAPSDARS